jgi:hypothetical protein
LTNGAGDGSVKIGRENFYLFFIEFRAEEIKSLNVLFIEDFTKVLMLSHSDRGQLASNILGGVAVINGVEVVSGSVSKKTDDLVEFGVTEGNQKE